MAHNHSLAGEGQPGFVPPATAVNAHVRLVALRTRPGRRAGGGVDCQGPLQPPSAAAEAKQAAATSSAVLSEDSSRQKSPGYMVTR